MKLRFDPEATMWMHQRVNELSKLAGTREDTQNLARVASKMRYKFSGAPSIVFLGGKERTLIAEMALYTAENSQTMERLIARRIMEVLTNAPSNDNADAREPESTD